MEDINLFNRGNCYRTKEEAETFGRSDRRYEAAVTALRQLARRLNGDWDGTNLENKIGGRTSSRVSQMILIKSGFGSCFHPSVVFKSTELRDLAQKEYETYVFEDGTRFIDVLFGIKK